MENNESTQNKYDAALAKYNTNLNDAEVAAEVAKIIEEKVPANNTPEVKKFLFNCIDLTTLNSTDSDESVMKFTQKVNRFDEEFPDLKNVAAICVHPNFAEVVKDTLEVEDVKIACVSAGFPSSQTFIEVKIAETAMAIMEGADEIDIVISVGKFLSGDYETMCDEIQELKATCKEHHLKVILETGALKTAANIKNGGRTPVVGIVHAVVLLLILVVLMPYAALIPMPAIAAILLMVAYNMSEWRQFARIIKTAPKSDVLVLVLTFLLTVVFDLVIAIEVGLILTCVLFMKRMSDTTKLRKWEDNADNSAFKNISPNAAVYELSGPLFFGAAAEILKVSAETGKNCIVLRMKGVTAIDSTGLRNLERLFAQCTEAGIVLILSHLNEQPRKMLEKSGLLEKIGSKNICPQIDAALLRAAELAE